VNNIDSQINDRMNTYAGNPQGLMQRYAQTQELVDLLALQKMKNDRAAATNAVQGAMQPPPGTVKGQLEQEAMQGARNDVLRSMAPGIQQQGVRTAQMQNRAAMGLPAQPAPNMARMAQGGIVGYQQGGNIMGPPEPNLYQRMGQGLKNYGANAQESMDILKAAKAGIGVPYEERSAVMKQVRDEIAAQNQNRDPNFIERMGQKLMNAGLNVEESKAILKKFYDTFGKTYEEMANPGMAMGGIVGYQQGGGVKGYAGLDGSLVEEDEAIIPLGALFELIGRGRDALFSPSRATQEAREIRRGEVEQAGERGVNLLNVLPPSQGLTPEQLASFDKYDVTGAVPTKIVEERRERVESGEAARDLAQQAARRAEANAARREGRSTIPQNEGVTADMYMMPKEELTMAQKLMQLPKVPREAEAEKGGLDIDFRALREFLTAGGGQTSIAGALGAGARGLGAYQTAEQGRQDKINQAAAELQLKRDLAVNEARMLTQKLMADYEGKITTAEIKVAQEALERLDDPLNQEYQSQVKAIREQFARQPIEMENALNRLREAHVQRAVSNVRRGVGLGSVPTTSAAITDMGLE
jgi:hypothetical protein